MSNNSLHQISVKELTELKLVGIRVVCEGEKYIEEIPKAAKLLQKRTNEIQHVLNGGNQIGAFVVEESSPEEDGYWVGVEVSKYEEIPDDMVTLTIPAQKYASILHTGPNDKIKESYELMHRWIAEEGLKRANNSWNLEIYQRGNNPDHPDDVRVQLLDSIY
ncbi:GyrI-like domain-containing protein [Evansella halocellulosilytica]|uniref:GyrI-like domain-containing protein n=1 Tax=Evansella halocellulosilytica TaxID=2011013 RepID=UPI000BB7D8ED|nr:GyrI-like domain-containing protein [Evansella halocellulosilytica]